MGQREASELACEKLNLNKYTLTKILFVRERKRETEQGEGEREKQTPG